MASGMARSHLGFAGTVQVLSARWPPCRLAANTYHDFASGVRDDRPELDSCLRALRKGDVLVVWKLDRAWAATSPIWGQHRALSARGVGLRVLAGQGRADRRAGADPQTHRGRAQGRTGPADARAAGSSQAAMAHRDTAVSELCRELGIRPVTLYRYVGPQGQLREQGQKVLAS